MIGNIRYNCLKLIKTIPLYNTIWHFTAGLLFVGKDYLSETKGFPTSFIATSDSSVVIRSTPLFIKSTI